MRVEGVNKIGISSLSVDCSFDGASKHRNSLEMWQQIVRRYDQRITSDNKSAYTLISNISERDRAKEVEHVGDVLRTIMNQVRQDQGRGEHARSQACARERAELQVSNTTMAYDELITTLENIMLDKVMTAPFLKPKKTDTSSSMDFGLGRRQ